MGSDRSDNHGFGRSDEPGRRFGSLPPSHPTSSGTHARILRSCRSSPHRSLRTSTQFRIRSTHQPVRSSFHLAGKSNQHGRISDQCSSRYSFSRRCHHFRCLCSTDVAMRGRACFRHGPVRTRPRPAHKEPDGMGVRRRVLRRSHPRQGLAQLRRTHFLGPGTRIRIRPSERRHRRVLCHQNQSRTVRRSLYSPVTDRADHHS